MHENPHDDILFLALHLRFLYTDYVGRRIYQCRCCERIYMIQSAQVSFTAMTGTSASWAWADAVNPQPKPAREPVPAALLQAFHDDELDPGVVPLTCACGTSLTIKKYSPESTISGTFCPVCGEQHWIRWDDGIVRHGKIEGK